MKKGTLTVVAGPMFSGKTGKLVAMVDVFEPMGHRVLTVKPNLDNRYSTKREPFGVTPDLMGLADERMELLAICQTCGGLARHTQRVKRGKSTVEVGAANKYIASCDSCHRIYR